MKGRHREIVRSARLAAAANESPLRRKHHELHFSGVIKPLGAVKTLFNLPQVAFAHRGVGRKEKQCVVATVLPTDLFAEDSV